MIIAIDGASGSGKSTTAKLLADKLNFIYLDTGAMYRAITLSFLNLSIDLENINMVSNALNNTDLSIKHKSGKFSVHLNGKNVNNEIRSEKVNRLVSSVSKIDIIRKKMVETQRNFSKNRNIIVEGRDIGSVVFPKAEFKFFLSADIKVRAERRFKEIKKDESINLMELASNLKERDKIDSSRNISPLIKTKDAIEINTTFLTINEQVDKIYNIITNMEQLK